MLLLGDLGQSFKEKIFVLDFGLKMQVGEFELEERRPNWENFGNTNVWESSSLLSL